MRKSISVALFSMVSTLLVLGIAVMGCSEWVLFGRYFAQERYEACLLYTSDAADDESIV